MEKLAFATLILLWVVWLAAEGKLVPFLELATKPGDKSDEGKKK